MCVECMNIYYYACSTYLRPVYLRDVTDPGVILKNYVNTITCCDVIQFDAIFSDVIVGLVFDAYQIVVWPEQVRKIQRT